MEFKKPQKITQRSIRKVDAVVTGLILWGIVASIYGLGKKDSVKAKIAEIPAKIESIREGKVSASEMLRMLVFGVPKEEASFWSKIASRFRSK